MADLESQPVRIAIDAMGGDHAPGEIVTGAIQAAREQGIGISLVGNMEALIAETRDVDIAGLENEYDIEIDFEKMKDMTTVGDLVSHVDDCRG